MASKECIAMLLAGGQGSRLMALTSKIAKPAVSFGGKFRIIDFSLSNCANSGIDTVGVLTQYRPYQLHEYVGSGRAWDLAERGGGVSILPPYATQEGGAWYAGTADAITQNLDYIKSHDPECVLILSGDHLYRMDYRKMLESHIEHGADLTVSVMPVPWEEASRFGIITANPDDGRIEKFTEKPEKPDSNLASMGIYIFSTDVLVRALEEDAVDQRSSHDFGNDIIPKLLAEGKRLYTYEFHGFWKDVGTIASFHETSMDLLGENPEFDLFDKSFPVMSNDSTRPPHFIGPDGRVDDCLVSNGCRVYGTARHSILSTDCHVGERAIVEDSVLLPGAVVKDGAHVVRAILGENAVVEEGVKLGSVDMTKDTAVVGNDVVIGRGNDPMINRKAIGYITANYTSKEHSALLESRPLASIPFMGRYRLIDFPLSNMMNAGIRTVGVVLPGNYRSLVDHLGSGREWELDRKKGGLFLLQGSAYGTAKKGIRFLLRDINTNKMLFQRASEPYVVMSATNIVFNMDLSDVIDAHERSGSGVTMIYKKADRQLGDVMKLDIDGNGRVTDLGSGCVYGENEFLDCFIINRDLLLQICEEYETLDYLDLFDAIRSDFGRIDVCTYEFKGLAVGMFSVDTYYRRSMEMLNPDVMHQLFTHSRPVMTKAHDAPPAKYSAGSNATNSFISAGCRIDGTVRGSTLSRDVVVESGAYVANSIIMQGCVIKRGARVENAIVDKNNVIEAGTVVSGTPDNVLVIPKVALKN